MKMTWVYLIKDHETGYHKIGKSDSPRDRLGQLVKQATLQPKPNEYTLVEAWLTTPDDETEMHKLFAEQRIRGEWFDLGEEHIAVIEEYFMSNRRFVEEGSRELEYFECLSQHLHKKVRELEEENKVLRDRYARASLMLSLWSGTRVVRK